MSSASTSTSTSRLGLCQLCNLITARYTCPACQFPSCSLACSTSHKVERPCSGIAAPIWSLPFKATDMSWGPLMRDQSYIASVGRKSEDIGKQLVKDKLIPSARATEGDGQGTRLDDRNDRENKMVYESRQEGVDLLLLPRGMSKRVKNASRWDPKNQRMEWVLDLVFHPPPSATNPTVMTCTTAAQPSSSTLYDALKLGFNQRDKKSKSIKMSKEDQEWIELQKKWLEACKPAEPEPDPVPDTTSSQNPAEQTTEVETEPTDSHVEDKVEENPIVAAVVMTSDTEPTPAPAAEDVTAEEEDEEEPAEEDDEDLDESPVILLLSLYTRPPTTSSNEEGDVDGEPSESIVAATITGTTKPPPRRVFVISPHLPSVRHALIGSTILEYPSFELWSREAFLRARLLGKLQIVDQPRNLDTNERHDSGESRWVRGRGRGRGMGGGRGRGRDGPSQRGFGGGRGRGRGGRDFGARDEGSRKPDSGWGKRGAGDDATRPGHKRARE